MTRNIVIVLTNDKVLKAEFPEGLEAATSEQVLEAISNGINEHTSDFVMFANKDVINLNHIVDIYIEEIE
ncbi:hypothetical protein [Peribacillus muralis]|uniref:hypothetical protein n=1 Tax=Peribacillus muralis TaxID=264697 RepID=UPI00366F1705